MTTFATVTPEALSELRSMMGKEVRRGVPFIEELSPDAIRHYAFGIGDMNPLWTAPDYAAKSVHGHLLAPPTILFATDRIMSGYVTGLPGIHAMFAGVDIQYRRALGVGDRIRGVSTLKDLIERSSRFSGRSFQQIYQIDFYDADDQLVATADSYCFRTERDTARKLGKYERKEKVWSTADIEDIAQRYAEQETRRRGARPRLLGDVQVGESLPEVIKGPYTATTAIAYLLGWGGLYVRAHADAFALFSRHPALGIPNEWGVPEPPERVHWDPQLAERVGVPGAYDYGPERVSWMGHLVTDWMGDAGFLRRLNVQVRRHNLIGDLVVCKGVVDEVRADGTVLLRLAAHNQDGQESARGLAEVVLPRLPLS